jgi:NhaA family Na+:H+ antiporter
MPLQLRIISAFQQFIALESAGGVLLLICTAAALVWANISPAVYDELWNGSFTSQIGWLKFPPNLHYFINDGLMVLFFFVVGLEIKRELLTGELSVPRQALLPVIAAAGGAIIPALLYFVLNPAGAAAAGWGIPMATDIAFALAVLTLLGKGVPLGLKVFLTALAIVDDLIAVLIIAVFYTAQLDLTMLVAAAVILALAYALNRAGVHHVLPYAVLGVALWYVVFHSGVHATLAGVLIALMIPAGTKLRREDFTAHSRELLDDFERCKLKSDNTDQEHCQADSIHALRLACERVESPLNRLEHSLHPWVAYLIIPLFALANAGVFLGGGMFGSALSSPVTWGIILGLIVGKQAGITLFTWLAVRLKLASLPAGVSWLHVYGVSWLAAIGFTMALFIGGLAFKAEAELLNEAKVGILVASLVAGITGWLILKYAGRKKARGSERSTQASGPV